MAHALKGNTTLRGLYLGYNQISDEGATALAHALKGNTTLQCLWLTYNKVSDDGVTALAHALKGNMTVQSLRLYTTRSVIRSDRFGTCVEGKYNFATTVS